MIQAELRDSGTMNKTQKQNLEKMGGRITTVGEFLNLSPAEELLIDLKIDLGEEIKRRRVSQGLTQAQAAKLTKISQPRLVALESGGPSVTIDALLRAVLALGATRNEVAELIAA